MSFSGSHSTLRRSFISLLCFAIATVFSTTGYSTNVNLRLTALEDAIEHSLQEKLDRLTGPIDRILVSVSLVEKSALPESTGAQRPILDFAYSPVPLIPTERKLSETDQLLLSIESAQVDMYLPLGLDTEIYKSARQLVIRSLQKLKPTITLRTLGTVKPEPLPKSEKTIIPPPPPATEEGKLHVENKSSPAHLSTVLPLVSNVLCALIFSLAIVFASGAIRNFGKSVSQAIISQKEKTRPRLSELFNFESAKAAKDHAESQTESKKSEGEHQEIRQSLRPETIVELSSIDPSRLIEVAKTTGDPATWRLLTDILPPESLNRCLSSLPKEAWDALLKSIEIEPTAVASAASQLLKTLRTEKEFNSSPDRIDFFRNRLLPSILNTLQQVDLTEQERILRQIKARSPDFYRLIEEQFWAPDKLDELTDGYLAAKLRKANYVQVASLLYALPEKHSTRIDRLIGGNLKRLAKEQLSRMRERNNDRNKELARSLVNKFLDMLRIDQERKKRAEKSDHSSSGRAA